MGVRDLSLALPGFAAMFEFFEVRGGLEKGLKRREALPKAMRVTEPRKAWPHFMRFLLLFLKKITVVCLTNGFFCCKISLLTY